MLLFIGGMEIVVVLFVALLFFGSKSIPDIARMMGKGMREFRRATDELKKEFNEETIDVVNEVKDINQKLKGKE